MSARARSFPIPFDDETVFSLASRYHLMCGMGSVKRTLHFLFGSPAVVLRVGLPGRLSNLESRFPEGYPLSVGELIEQHTAYPYYWPFLTLPRRVKIWNAMHNTDTGNIKALLGALASRHGAKDQLRFCSECAHEDLESKGQPYWRRAHQLPGVLVCQKHARGLYRRRDNPANPMRFALFLPPLKPDPDNFVSCLPDDMHDDGAELLRIAKISAECLARERSVFTAGPFKALYHQKIEALMVEGRVGRNAPEWLAQLLTTRLGQFTTLEDYRFLGANRTESWVRDTLRVDRSTSHPLTHIILISALFDDLQTAITESRRLTSARQDKTLLTETSARPNISVRRVSRPSDDTPVWCVSLPELLIEKGLSMTAAARILGKTTTTVRIHAERMGIVTKRRPKRITSDLESKIMKALRHGSPRSEIAQRYQVSLSTVDRLLATHKDVRDSHLQSQQLMRRALAHGRLVSSLANNPHWGRKQIRADIPADYMWLYRNDRQWLEQQLNPRNMLRAASRRRMGKHNEGRDREYLRDLQDAAQQIMSRDQKPVRVTRSLLGRMTGLTSVIEKYLGSFPIIRESLPSLCESPAQFKHRRLSWAVKTLRDEGKGVLAWRLRRLAGLGPSESPDIELRIAGAVSCQPASI